MSNQRIKFEILFSLKKFHGLLILDNAGNKKKILHIWQNFWS